MSKPTRAGSIGLCSGLLLLCAVFFLGPLSAWAADCEFVLGFATLKALIDEAEGPEKVGQCLENEHFNPENGDSLQQTTGGLLVWRKADNWTAFTDGYRTWINGPYGLQMRLNTEQLDWEAPAALTIEALKNAEYLSEWPASGKAKLTDGTYFEAYEPGTSGLHLSLSEHIALGDLNGDGAADAAVVLIANPSGSGTFRHLAAVVNERGQPQHVASAFLGDRVRIESLAIQDGQIVVQLIGHGPDDPLCCPSQEQTHAFRLEGDTLEPAPLTLELLENAEYQSEFPASGKAKLTDGRYFEAYEPGSASGVHLTLREHLALADLNGDGIDDAVVILEASGGGSGTFRYLAAVLNERGQPRHVASALLGDRVRIESLAIEAGQIVVQLIGHGPGDGQCCPTQEQTHAFRLEGDTLVPAGLTIEALRNAEYQSEFPASGKAKLTDGTYQEAIVPGSASKLNLILSEHVAFGDLNGDGAADAAVVLIADPGGSGTFRHLAAVVSEQGQLQHVASAFLGDRVKVESLAIQDGEIVVQMIAHGPNDGLCCPTQKVTRVLRLTGDALEPAPLTLELLKNAEYQSEFPTGGKAKLTDGTFFEPFEPGSASGIHLTLSEHVAFDDLNGNGVDDAAVVLIANPGGSGTFRHLAAVVNEGGQPRHAASAFLGDRVRIESLAIEAGLIVVGMIAHGPDDPLCCPTQKMSRAFRLAGDTLKMATPIVDVLWRWERFGDTRGQSWDIIVTDPQKYTLRLLPDGTFRAKADCNLASGTYTAAGSSLILTLGPVTLAECPPESLSNNFLTWLGEVVTYVLHEGKLFLNLKIDSGNMVFINTEPAP